jgi:glycosyltransferase involved in cell wall biosynthesis
MNCSVVIPVYKGRETLEPLTQRLAGVLPDISEHYEVIFVNDGSPDDSWEIIKRLTQRYPWVRGIALMRNYGQDNATLCGIRAARHEVTITMDDDLQHPPEEIPNLLSKLKEGYDVVYAAPRKRRQSWWKSFFSTLVKRSTASLIGVRTVSDISAFKAFQTSLRNAFVSFNGPDVLVDALLSWGTTRFTSVPVDEAPRAIGRSNYSFMKLIKVSFLVLTSYTTLPLRFASVVGFAFTLLGLLGFLYVIVTYFLFGSVPGFPFLASIIMLFSGAQLFASGIIGEYLARVFERTSSRPSYAIAMQTPEVSEGSTTG